MGLGGSDFRKHNSRFRLASFAFFASETLVLIEISVSLPLVFQLALPTILTSNSSYLEPPNLGMIEFWRYQVRKQ